MHKLTDSIFRRVVDNSLAGVYVVGSKGKVFVYVNRAMASMFGYEPEEIIGKMGPSDLVYPGDWELVADKIERRLRGESRSERYRFRGIRKDGKIIWCEVYGGVEEEGGDRLIAGTILDITPQLEWERRISESERFYRALFEGANDGILVMNREGVFVDCNERAIEIFGCSRKEELLGLNPFIFSPENQPDGSSSEKRAFDYIKKALSGKPQRFYWKHIKKDGTPFDAEVSLRRVDVGEDVVLRAVVRDVTDKLRLEKELARRGSSTGISLKTQALASLSSTKWEV